MAESGFNPVNELEEILVRATTQPEVRPEFYQKLLASQIWLLCPQIIPAPGASVTDMLEASAGIQLATWIGSRGEYIPVFSSLEQLQAAIMQAESPYKCMVLDGSDAFAMLAQKPINVILNPGATYGKYFTPEEINGLADGSILDAKAAEEPEVPPPAPVLFSQPAEYPHCLVAALQKLFATFPEIEAAYLAQTHNPAGDGSPRLLIGIKGDGDMAQIASAAAAIAESVPGFSRPVDFVQAGAGKSSADDYLQNQTTPFYQRMETGPG